jgi:glutathione S-transferase
MVAGDSAHQAFLATRAALAHHGAPARSSADAQLNEGRRMIILYSSPSTASLVVHWLLIELDLPHEVRNLDLGAREQKSPEYLRLNPAGVVPTLVLDGRVICEAAAIVMHLADLHANAGLAPTPGSPERAQYYQWMFFLANTLQPAYRAWFYPTEPAGAPNVDATKAHARGQIEAAWERVSTFLTTNGPYLLGTSVSAADFLMTMLMRWSRNMPRPTDTWPALFEHASRMKARPSFREVYARQGLTDWS